MRIAPATVFVWDGGAGDGKWTTGANWVGDVAPTPGSALLFQPPGFDVVTNDFPSGTEFDSLTFSNPAFGVTVTGNEIVLTSGIRINGPGGGAFVDVPVKLAADQTFFTEGALFLSYSQTKDFNGHILTLAGPGRFEFSGQFIDTSATGGAELHYSGTGSLFVEGVGETAPVKIVVGAGSFESFATLPQTEIVLNGGSLKGISELGALTLHGGTIEGRGDITDGVQFGVNGDFTMDAASTFNAQLPLPLYSVLGHLKVTGSVTLGDATLNVRVSQQPRNGDQFPIIRNDGSDPVVGTFFGLPEGALFNAVAFFDEPRQPFGTNVQLRISYQGGDGNDVVVTADFPEVQVSQDGRVATFTDVDGDLVTIKTKLGALNPRDFRLVRTGDVGGAQLALIDFESAESAAALNGTNLKITANPGPQGGDGHVNVGALKARFPFNHVIIDGDLGRGSLSASSTKNRLAAHLFDVQSLGALGTTTQLQDSFAETTLFFNGNVDKLKVHGDVRTQVAGRYFERITIGGSLIGGDDAGSGSFNVEKIVNAKIAGDVIGGSGIESGAIVVGRLFAPRPDLLGIGTIVIGGSLIGGTADGTGSIRASSGSIENMTIGGSIFTGSHEPLTGDAAVTARWQIGSMRVLGDVAGNADNPVLIAAAGSFTSPVDGIDRAIGALEVFGSVRHAQVLAGYAFRGFDPGDSGFALTGVNADASIGSINVGGNWTGSTALASVSAGPDGFFGTRDDGKLRGAGVRDNPEIFSEIAALIIHGQANGTARAGDSFGIVAEKIGFAQIGDTLFSFEPGPRNGKDFYFLGSTGPGPTGGSTDFTIHEAKG